MAFPCEIDTCRLTFETPEQLDEHMQAHQDGMVHYSSLVCGFCGENFSDEVNLHVHMNEEHHRVACPECGTLLVRHKLKKHLLIHNPDREMFPCQEEGCDKTYSTAFNRDQHVRSAHRRERPFQCTFPGCTQRFAFKASQLRHESNVHVAPTHTPSPPRALLQDLIACGPGGEPVPSLPPRRAGGRRRKPVPSVEDMIGASAAQEQAVEIGEGDEASKAKKSRMAAVK